MEPAGGQSEAQLAQNFVKQFTATTGIVPFYDSDLDNHPLNKRITDTLSQRPALIYFPGDGADLSSLLSMLPTSRIPQVLGGYDAYPVAGTVNLDHFHLIYPAYGDSCPAVSIRATQYICSLNKQLFQSPPHQSSNGYRNNVDKEVLLTSDVVQVLISAINNILGQGKQNVTSESVQKAITDIKGPKAILGASGVISIGYDGNPFKKAVYGVITFFRTIFPAKPSRG